MTVLNACIIGAASGIGEATARELAARGYAISAADRDADRLAPLAAAIGASTHALDLTNTAAVDGYAQTLPDLDAVRATYLEHLVLRLEQPDAWLGGAA